MKYGVRPQGTILRAKVRQLAYVDEVSKSKWVRPSGTKTPRNSRTGQSPSTSLRCALYRALARKKSKNKKTKSQNGFGLKEVRPTTPRNSGAGQCPSTGFGLQEVRYTHPRKSRTSQRPSASFRCALYQALAGKNKKIKKPKKVKMGLVLNQ